MNSLKRYSPEASQRVIQAGQIARHDGNNLQST